MPNKYIMLNTASYDVSDLGICKNSALCSKPIHIGPS